MVRVCQAPVDDTVDTPYLRFAEMAKKLGKIYLKRIRLFELNAMVGNGTVSVIEVPKRA